MKKRKIILIMIVIGLLFVVLNNKNNEIERYVRDNERKIYSEPVNGDIKVTSEEEKKISGCYGNEPYMGLASEVKWFEGREPDKDSIYKYKYSEITEAKKCERMPDNGKCVDSNTKPTKQTASVDSCEGKTSMIIKDTIKVCSSAEKNFYKIECKKEVMTSFGYKGPQDFNSPNKYEMFKGLGFKVEINVKTDVVCQAEFDENEWINAYNNVMNKLKTIRSITKPTYTKTAYGAYIENDDKKFESYINKLKEYDGSYFTKETESRIYELRRLAKDVEDIVNVYNERDKELKELSNEEANLSMTYKINGGKNKNFNYEFEKEVKESDPVKKDSKKHTAIKTLVSWLESPVDYTWSYEKNTILVPKKVYLDKNTGAVKDNEKDSIAGGNKIYLDYNTDVQDINRINITVSGLGGNDSTVINDKCNIKIKDQNIIYRPIDITNPFINSKWTPGANWVNAKFDFRNVIKKDIWSETGTNNNGNNSGNDDNSNSNEATEESDEDEEDKAYTYVPWDNGNTITINLAQKYDKALRLKKGYKIQFAYVPENASEQYTVSATSKSKIVKIKNDTVTGNKVKANKAAKVTIKVKDSSGDDVKSIKIKIHVYEILPDETLLYGTDFKLNSTTDNKHTYDGKTLKYNVYSSDNVFITTVWVKDAAKQLKIALYKKLLCDRLTNCDKVCKKTDSSGNCLYYDFPLPSGYGFSTGNQPQYILKEVEHKPLIAVNGGLFNENYHEVGAIVYKNDGVAVKGVLNQSNGKDVYYSLMTIDSNGSIGEIPKANVKDDVQLAQSLAGIPYATTHNGYWDRVNITRVLTDYNSNKDKSTINYWTMLCRIDDNNFALLSTNTSIHNNKGMWELNRRFNCNTIVRLDGGKSVRLYGRKNNTENSTKYVHYDGGSGRTIPDMVYFIEQ